MLYKRTAVCCRIISVIGIVVLLLSAGFAVAQETSKASDAQDTASAAALHPSFIMDAEALQPLRDRIDEVTKELPNPDGLHDHIANAAPHPRLFMDAASLERLRNRIAKDKTTEAIFALVREDAEALLGAAPVEYRKQGKRLLSVSREVIRRVLCLSLVYRVTEEPKFASRAILEMETAALFENWNPTHFLDVAEMTTALAIGYDWLHPLLNADQEALIRGAILERGIAPSYLTRHGWVRGHNNWNQVCHGGMVLGALALLDHEPGLAAGVIVRALDGLPYAMKTYEPDGVYVEGPSYWEYGTEYNAMLIEALETAIGSDFGLADAPGFRKSGTFPLYMTGPTRLQFNFADCGQRRGPYIGPYWFARRWQDPGILWFEEQWVQKMHRGEAISRSRFFPFMLVWRDFETFPAPEHPLHWKGEGMNPVAVHRTSWTDPDAVYLAVKAGTPGAPHGHMDIGAFVLDADGLRWAVDFGMESYGALEARNLDIWNKRQHSDRWRIYRYHNISHNTLTVNGEEQKVNASAPITRFSAEAAFPHTVMDMRPVYEDQLARAERGFVLLPDGRVLIQDEIAAPDKAAQVRWAMATPGELQEVQDGSALLIQTDKRLRFEVLSPEGVSIETYSTEGPNEWDSPNPGTRQIGFQINLEANESATLTVLLTPGSVEETARPDLMPLSQWPGP
jgi:hypothetical protein